MGSLTANQEWFKVWRTIDGQHDAAPTSLELEVLIRGVFDRQRFLDLLRAGIVRRTLVKDHDDIGTERFLELDGRFRGDEMLASVYM